VRFSPEAYFPNCNVFARIGETNLVYLFGNLRYCELRNGRDITDNETVNETIGASNASCEISLGWLILKIMEKIGRTEYGLG